MIGTVTIFACVLVLLYVYRKRRIELLQRIGVPVAGSPNVLFGSMLDFKGLTYRERLRKWTQEYGKIYGFYDGPRANIVTSDLDFLQDVLVKQFTAFNARKLYPLQRDPDTEPFTNMLLARNKRWKRLRMSANPAFSTGKMKQIIPMIQADVDRFMLNMAENSAETNGFNIYDYFQRLTLDVIFECGFGAQIEAQRNPNNIYLIKIREAFSSLGVNIPAVLSIIFFELRVVIRALYNSAIRFGLAHSAFRHLSQYIVPQIVRMRTEAKETARQKDLMQLMLDAHHENSGTSATEISMREIEAQVNLFMIAGYETSSTTLAYCAYLLATHPAIQKRLQQEVDKFYDHLNSEGQRQQKQNGSENSGEKSEEDGDGQSQVMPTYDDLQSEKLRFLEMVIYETLRMYPIAFSVVNRMCMEDTEVRGIVIPSGMHIIADVTSVHNDPEIWGPEDPADFCPDRFAPERHSARHPLALLSFGGGPRTCIGMRFAMMEIKMTLVRLLRKYTICECPKTEKPLQLREIEVIAPKNGVYVRLEKRN